MSYSAKVIAGGKIVIPAELRREFGIKDGDTLVIERDASGGLHLKTYLQVAREVQAEIRRLATPAKTSIVDDLIADRRAEAARDEEKGAGVMAGRQ